MSAPADTLAFSSSPPLPFAYSLGHNYIGAEGVTKLAAVLKETKITILGYAAGPRVFAFVSRPADTPAVCLTILAPPFSHRLDENELGPKGGAALAEGLKGNSTLQSLS